MTARPSPARRLVRRARSHLSAEERALRRLLARPRFEPGQTDVLGAPISYVDGPSFVSAARAIFHDEIYAFPPHGPEPRILDCGANIGLATIWWKRRHPPARIVAFEPDPAIFAVLTANCRRLGLDDVTLVDRAVWVEETEVDFVVEGADAGRLLLHGSDQPHRETTRLPTVRLRDYLAEPVDMLKLDVEGAEVDLLLDCADSLSGVAHVFVEFHSFADQPQRLDEVLAVLRAAGFRLQVKSEYSAPRPFVERPVSEGMDLRVNVFAFRPTG